MAKRKSKASRKHRGLPALTPRAKEIVNHVINTVALGTHDNEGELGAIAERLEFSPARLQTLVNTLSEQGYVTLKRDFVYPTVAALRWQNPELSEAEAAAVLKRVR
jgi:DNA-binding IclR family transcriptional regulator